MNEVIITKGWAGGLSLYGYQHYQVEFVLRTGSFQNNKKNIQAEAPHTNGPSNQSKLNSPYLKEV